MGNCPLEADVENALKTAGIEYIRADNGVGLDFYLPNHDVYIEVKQFHSDRISDQMGRVKNVIAVQGEKAVRLLILMLSLAARPPA
jgi:hypothetical protein